MASTPDSSNPYRSPSSDEPVVGVISGQMADLRAVAKYQKGIITCILGYFLLIMGGTMLPDAREVLMLRLGLMVSAVVVVFAGVIYTFLLAVKVYSVGLGVLLGLMTFVPCLGLISLLVVNSKATTVLKNNGFRVGFLGANLAEIDARIRSQGS